MSNVKINGNTYNGVDEIRLMKADDSGYAIYKEGQTEEGLTWEAVTINFSGVIPEDIDDPDVTTPQIGRLQSTKFGTIKLTGATKMAGGCPYSTFDNLLLPHVVAADNFINYGTRDFVDVRRSFSSIKCSGVLDLGSFSSGINWGNTMFQNAQIGTLKLGPITLTSNSMSSATITNFVWNCAGNASNPVGVLTSATKITNLYVPAEYVATISGKIDDGTLTKIDHVYSMADWSDD